MRRPPSWLSAGRTQRWLDPERGGVWIKTGLVLGFLAYVGVVLMVVAGFTAAAPGGIGLVETGVTLFRDRGIVLRTIRLGEADRIVTLMTEHHGKVRAVAKGVRRT